MAEQAANSELNEAELLGELDESVEAPVETKDPPVEAKPEVESPKTASKTVAKIKPAKAGIKRKAAPEKKPVSAPEAAGEPAAKKSPEKMKPAVAKAASPAEAEVEVPPESPSKADTDKQNDNEVSASPKVPIAKMTEEEVRAGRASDICSSLVLRFLEISKKE